LTQAVTDAEKSFKVAPLQRVVGEIVTDPGELAAAERLRKRLRKRRKPGHVKPDRTKTGKRR
jgi:hypothetical protein